MSTLKVDTLRELMVSAFYNIVLEAGSDFSLAFVLKNDGEIIDLTDWIFAAQIRQGPDAGIVANLDTAISADGERLTISLPHEETSAILASGITQKSYRWDLFGIRSDGVRMRLLEGQATVVNRITQYV